MSPSEVLPGVEQPDRRAVRSVAEGDGYCYISVVAPAFNEEECLPLFIERTSAVLETISSNWELIIVDDGSKDRSAMVIEHLAKDEPRIVSLRLSRNFGHQAALTAGLNAARGQCVVSIDADLQDPPEVIPDLVNAWLQGADVVAAVRTERAGESWFKRWSASSFYRLLRKVSKLDIDLDAGDFRLLDRCVVDAVAAMPERHRFVRALTAWVGFRHASVDYKRSARFAGTTKYPFRKMLRLAVNAILGFSAMPLHLVTIMGVIVSGLCALAIPIAIILRSIGFTGFPGQTTVLLVVMFLGGVQMLGIGIVGEYLGRIYDETRQRPLYLLAPRRRDRRDELTNEPRLP
jgi:polyisoprenyl-phosphate glycosyltransferase